MAPKSIKQISLLGSDDEVGRMRIGMEEEFFLHLTLHVL